MLKQRKSIKEHHLSLTNKVQLKKEILFIFDTNYLLHKKSTIIEIIKKPKNIYKLFKREGFGRDRLSKKFHLHFCVLDVIKDEFENKIRDLVREDAAPDMAEDIFRLILDEFNTTFRTLKINQDHKDKGNKFLTQYIRNDSSSIFPQKDTKDIMILFYSILLDVDIIFSDDAFFQKKFIEKENIIRNYAKKFDSKIKTMKTHGYKNDVIFKNIFDFLIIEGSEFPSGLYQEYSNNKFKNFFLMSETILGTLNYTSQERYKGLHHNIIIGDISNILERTNDYYTYGPYFEVKYENNQYYRWMLHLKIISGYDYNNCMYHIKLQNKYEPILITKGDQTGEEYILYSGKNQIKRKTLYSSESGYFVNHEREGNPKVPDMSNEDLANIPIDNILSHENEMTGESFKDEFAIGENTIISKVIGPILFEYSGTNNKNTQ